MTSTHRRKRSDEEPPTTDAETTVEALASWALGSLKPGGHVSVAIYPGHPAGAREAVALRAFARRSETRRREQPERESERAVEDRRRQRHVDARLTRLEDAVAALTRKRALEEKADAERTAAAAAAATRSRSRGIVAGFAGMGIGETFSPFGFDPRTPSASVFTPSRPNPGLRAPRAFAAAGARAELAVAAPKPPREPQPPMGSLP